METGSERVERRLVAIFAADVEGYSRLMGQDEVRTLRTLTAHREVMDRLIRGHGGRIANTAGDSVLAEFPSAVDAVQCAVEVQKALAALGQNDGPDRALRFRIGVHVGDVMVRGTDLLGDGVNIAARLESLAEPGAVCISGDAHRHVRKALALTYIDLGLQQVKNIDEPVQAFSVGVTAPLTPASLLPKPATQSRLLPLPDKPSIAVLPFTNMSGDPEQEYFADGMVEEIITGLARLRWLFVIARNSSFTYKGRVVDVRQVGRDLGVRYLLEGSVRKADQRIRITAQLVEAGSGSHLWAEKYDGSIEDVFDLQDRITLDVVQAIAPSVQRAEMERVRRTRPENLVAYDHFLRALPHAWENNPTEAAKALEHLKEALRIDPDYATAHACAAWCGLMLGRRTRDPAGDAAAIAHARAALEGSTDDPTALTWAGFVVAMLDRDYDTAQAALNRALATNPDSTLALGFSAIINATVGRFDVAVGFADKASQRSSPLDPLRHNFEIGRSIAYYHTSRYTEAIEAAQRAIEVVPRFAVPRMLLAAALSSSGRVDEARKAGLRLLEVEPGYRVSNLDRVNNGPPERVGALKDALRAAGLPEH